MTGEPILHTQVYADSNGFDALAPEWNELLRDSPADTVFLTHQWQSTWWHHLGDGTPTLIAVREEDGRLVGLAPLYRSLTNEGQWELNTVGCVDVSDYLDLIPRRGHGEAVYSALLDLLLASSAGLAWDVLKLCNVPAGSPTLTHLAPLAAARDLAVTDRIQEVCPIVTLDGDWDVYLASLDGKERRELRRKLRKANPHVGVDWTLVGPEHDLPAEVDRFLHLMALSHPDKAEFLHENHRAFMHAVACFAAAEGWLELTFLTVQGEPAATMFNLVYNNRTLLYNSGLDPQRFRHLSPGIVLTAFLIQHSIAAGREAFDFLRGDEPYKYQLGGVDHPIYQLVIRRE
jgi:CelD/BcsL family acetyltransferase involved in cellulose biosynthesis